MPHINGDNGKFQTNLPPYHCKRCGVELTDSNWSDSRRDTKKHGRYFICKECQNKANRVSEYYVRNGLESDWFFECCTCGEAYEGMIFHEINWLSHDNKNYAKYYKDNFGRFIFVCKRCHQMIHQLHNITEMEIEEILELLGWKELV